MKEACQASIFTKPHLNINERGGPMHVRLRMALFALPIDG